MSDWMTTIVAPNPDPPDPPDPMTVAIGEAARSGYPSDPPFDPAEIPLEMRGAMTRTDPANASYATVRQAFALMRLDAGHQGSADWNPLGDVIRPGDRVLVKPNLVRHFHGDGAGLEALVTHGSVIRAVLDYAALALKGTGSITVGDSPLQYSDFNAVLGTIGLDRVMEHVSGWSGVPIRGVDFRRERSEKRGALIVTRVRNKSEPGGYHVVDLGGRSRFAGATDEQCSRFRVTQYDPKTMRRAHGGATHAYFIPDTVLAADVVINVPKLKTHRKAGLTAAMKNLVRINGSKDWLPHHTFGAKDDGGDEYARSSLRKRAISRLRDAIEARRSVAARRLLRVIEQGIKATGRIIPFPDPFWEGSWSGNDTLWRMVHDLHTVLFFADRAGVLKDVPQRRYLAVVDAIVAGEGEGPMRPARRAAGLIVAGAGPAAVDTVCCRLMGFDESRVPLLRHAADAAFHPRLPGASEIRIASQDDRWNDLFTRKRAETLRFAPPAAWAGALEMER